MLKDRESLVAALTLAFADARNDDLGANGVLSRFGGLDAKLALKPPIS